MPDPIMRQRFRQGEQKLQSIAERLKEWLPDGLCFALIIFTPGKDGYAGYVCNAKRTDMIRALRECADTLEAHADSPPGSNLERN